MKKTLIAVAALAATGAFAQVNVTGTFDLTFRNNSVDFAGPAVPSRTDTVLGKDGIGTTGVIFSGNEDLGGGLKAVYLWELNFNAANTGSEGGSSATGSTFSTGQAFVGLEGGFGSVKFGAPNSPTLTTQGGRAGSFGTKDGGRASLITPYSAAEQTAGAPGSLMGVAVTRFDSSITYTSPNFSGFSVAAMYVPETDNPGTTTTPGKDGKVGAQTDIGLFYSNGPIAAGVSAYSKGEITQDGALANGGTAAAGKLSQTSYYVTYNFGFAKFGLGGHDLKVSSTGNPDSKWAGYNLLAEVPLSPALTLTANLQKLNDKTTDNLDQSQSAVGVQYALSKRSTTYARYITQKIDNLDPVADAGINKKADRVLVGLRHNF